MKLCECGCGQEVKHNKRFIDYHYLRCIKRKSIGTVQGPKQLCECGCSQEVTKIQNRFIRGHHNKLYEKPIVQGPKQLCECGCGQIVINISNRFIHGHHNKIRKSINDKNYCKMCKSKSTLERHHLVPRKYGLNNDEYNLITLCKNCHDKVEILTTDWIDSGKEYSAFIFRRLITNVW